MHVFPIMFKEMTSSGRGGPAAPPLVPTVVPSDGDASDEPSSDEESDPEDVFALDSIKNAVKHDGRIVFRCQWEGHPDSDDDTWEVQDSLLSAHAKRLKTAYKQAWVDAGKRWPPPTVSQLP